MRQWVTEFRAFEASTGLMKTWAGENISAPTAELAQQWCDKNAGHLKVIGELIAEIPCEIGAYEPDWKNQVDYETIQLN
jgi:hypothetical protein